MILIRFVLYVAIAVLAGTAWFNLFALAPARRGGMQAWLAAGAVAAALASLVSLGLLAAQMAATPLWPIDLPTIRLLLSGTSFGTAWLIRMAALTLAIIAMPRVPRSTAAGTTVALMAAVALATLAWTGHGAMDEGARGWLHLGADILHLGASALWIGALMGLSRMVLRTPDRVDLIETHAALRSFGPIGTLLVGVLVATGAVNAWLLVGPQAMTTPWATSYGRLLLAKLALFGLMLALAALNRFRLTPDFGTALAVGDHAAARRALRISLLSETGCAMLILALVAWLGTLAPPISGG